MTRIRFFLALPILGVLMSAQSPTEDPCAVVELRRYITHPGMRDTLIALFEQRFIEPQEEQGIRVLGQFRQSGEPDRYVWLRGFAGMEARKRALEGFYYGPVWQANRDAANRTLVDNDNVLLLRPARPGSGLKLDPAARPPQGAPEGTQTRIVITQCFFTAPADAAFLSFFEGTVAPLLRKHGADPMATYVTEERQNTFPKLVVREGEHVFLWITRYPGDAAYARVQQSLDQDPAWARVQRELRAKLIAAPEVLGLAPAARSLLR